MFITQPPATTLLVSRGTYDNEPVNWNDVDLSQGREEVADVHFEKGVRMGKVYDLVQSFLERHAEGIFCLFFDAREDGVRIVLRLYIVGSIGIKHMACDGDGVMYLSEGKEIELDDLEWRKVEDRMLYGERRLSRALGSDLTEEKGGMLEADWWRAKHLQKKREWLARQIAARGYSYDV